MFKEEQRTVWLEVGECGVFESNEVHMGGTGPHGRNSSVLEILYLNYPGTELGIWIPGLPTIPFLPYPLARQQESPAHKPEGLQEKLQLYMDREFGNHLGCKQKFFRLSDCHM